METQGIIVKASGGFYTVESSEGVFECRARGIFRKKNISPVCGDVVKFSKYGEDCIIEEIFSRKSILIRPPIANLDVIVFVCATCEPRPNVTLLDKFIAIAEYKGIAPAVVFTKIDKCSASELIEIYKKVGIAAFLVNNISGEGVNKIKEYLSGKFAAFIGNTGVGKSSLVNNIFPELEIRTDEISKKLGRGKHTTRTVQLYRNNLGGYIADTPGFSTLQTNRYDIIFKEKLADCFREFNKFAGMCKFPDCSHTKEKGCAIIKAVESGEIAKSRYSSYVEMYQEAKQLKEWEYKDV